VSVDFVTLADVRVSMETKGGDTALDPLITSLIPIASQAILDRTQRQITPKDDGPTTHKFRVSGWHVDLAPFDLRTVTSMTFDPDGGGQVLLTHTDYELVPMGAQPNGVYTGVQLSQWISLSTTKMMNFGFADLSIQGAWGFATVPDPVKQACIVAIRSWLRRDMDTYAQLDASGGRMIQPQAFGTYKLPPASLALLDPYMRFPGGVAVA
jgi:hypothetical protein